MYMYMYSDLQTSHPGSGFDRLRLGLCTRSISIYKEKPESNRRSHHVRLEPWPARRGMILRVYALRRRRTPAPLQDLFRSIVLLRMNANSTAHR
jgi:hypothetical protein